MQKQNQFYIYAMSAYAIREKDGIYFLTSTIVGWVDVFTRQQYRDIILDSFVYCRKNKNLCVHGYVIMSNHIHWLASAKPGFELDAVIRDFKKHTSKEIVKAISANEKESRKEWLLNMFAFAGHTHADNEKNKLWQKGNHPELIYTDKFFDQKLNYIHNNPVRAGLVELPEDYLYSSARDYQGKKGLIEIDTIILTQFVK